LSTGDEERPFPLKPERDGREAPVDGAGRSSRGHGGGVEQGLGLTDEESLLADSPYAQGKTPEGPANKG